MMDRWLPVDTLLLIPMLKIYVFGILDGQMERQTDGDITLGGLGNLNGPQG